MSETEHRPYDDAKVVDNRPPICPNGCGLLAPADRTSVVCEECGYERQVVTFETFNTPARALELEVGDVIEVEYEKGDRCYSVSGRVVSVSEEDDFVSVRVRDNHRTRSYELKIGEWGVAVWTDYAKESANQSLGSNGNVTRA